MENLGAEVGELGCFGERQLRNQTRVGDDARIGGEHAVDIGPDLDLVDLEAGAENRCRVIRSAAPERRRHPRHGGADESADDRDLAGGDPRADDLPGPGAGGVHVGHRRGVLAVGDQHLARIHPGARQLLLGERRRDDPAAGQLTHRQQLVGRARRDVAVLRPRSRVRGQRVEIVGEAALQRFERLAADEARRDGDVTGAEIAQDFCRLVALPLAGQPPGLDKAIGDLGHRRHDDDRRLVGGIRGELLADDVDDPVHRLRVGDRGAAEFHDDVHSSPSRCISSALRMAAPAAPRIVLWPSATNL
jgi:hypothetical protein